MQFLTGSNPRGHKLAKIVGAGALTLAMAATFLPPSQPAEAVGSASNWLGYINEYRAESGLRPVNHNKYWDAGTKYHSCYMNQHGLTHSEVPTNAGYTTAGATAGANSNISGLYGSSGNQFADEKLVIDGWMSGPYHAIGLLRPGWVATSLGICYTNGSPRKFSATLDVLRGITSNEKRNIVFPGRGATTQLYRFTSESPNPTADCAGSANWGLPLIAMFTGPATNATATVRGPGVNWSSPQLCVLDYEDVSSSVAKQILQGANAVIVIPPAILYNGTYNVSVQAGGQSADWAFNVNRPGGTAPTTTTTTTRPPTTTTTTTRPPTTTTTTTRPPTTTTTTTRPPTTTTTAPRPTTTTTRPPTTTTTAPRPTTTTTRPPTTTTTAPRPTTTTIPIPKQAPIARVSPGRDQTVKLGSKVSFNGSTSIDPDGGPLRYEWRTTGLSGVRSTYPTFGRTFDKPGRYGVELTVTDDEGQLNKKYISIVVSDPEPPIAAFTPGNERQVKVGAKLSFNGSASRDPDGGSVRYEWRTTGYNGVRSTYPTFARTFDKPGRYGVELTVIDDEGQANKKHIDVWVTEPELPIATFTPGSDQNVKVGAKLSFNGSASRDPDGGSVRYEWRTTGYDGVRSTYPTFSRTFDKPGRYGIQLNVIDDEGQVSKKHINIWVS